MLSKISEIITFGYGMSDEDFKEARARTRLLVELGDIGIQGKGMVTLAFDIGGFMATQVDIYEANATFKNKVLATCVNVAGISAGIVGFTPQGATYGAAIDTAAYVAIDKLLKPVAKVVKTYVYFPVNPNSKISRRVVVGEKTTTYYKIKR